MVHFSAYFPFCLPILFIYVIIYKFRAYYTCIVCDKYSNKYSNTSTSKVVIRKTLVRMSKYVGNIINMISVKNVISKIKQWRI